MELMQEELELSFWITEDMEVLHVARPRESTLLRLCLGRGADIWAYILQDVCSQRNGHLDNPKICRKLELEATVACLQAETRKLNQSLELMD